MDKDWYKSKGDKLYTIKIINFPDGKRKMIKIKQGTNHNYVMYSRYLMGGKLGRELKSSELVHHINGDMLDDRIKNLKLVSRSKHTSHHRKGKIPIEGIKASSKFYEERRKKFMPKVMKMHYCGYSLREIDRQMSLSRNTVTKIVNEWG